MQNTITIPAREVVAGMLLQYADGVWRVIDDVWADGIRAHVEPHAAVGVQLPGPSPRELLCSCCNHIRSDWRDHAMRSPDDHAQHCPVRRLRLRVWPAPLGGVPWTWSVACSVWALRQGSGEIRVHAANLATKLHALHDDNATAAIVRECFCLPADHSEQTKV